MDVVLVARPPRLAVDASRTGGVELGKLLGEVADA
jgi:hypothetical protein